MPMQKGTFGYADIGISLAWMKIYQNLCGGVVDKLVYPNLPMTLESSICDNSPFKLIFEF